MLKFLTTIIFRGLLWERYVELIVPKNQKLRVIDVRLPVYKYEHTSVPLHNYEDWRHYFESNLEVKLNSSNRPYEDTVASKNDFKCKFTEYG